MTDPEVIWEERKEFKRPCWSATYCGIRIGVEETKDKRTPYDVIVCGARVAFKKTLEAAKACAIRQANL